MKVPTRKKQASTPPPIDLDALHSAEVIAPWLGLSKRTVLELARQGKVPCVRFNERVLRFHPRTILAKA